LPGDAGRFEGRRRGAFSFADRRAGARLHKRGLIDAAALAHVSAPAFVDECEVLGEYLGRAYRNAANDFSR
jgi:hypothetical protein